MSATPDIAAEDLVTVEIDGTAHQARKGAMIIEVTDAAGIEVPRFCYHRKLSVAANCRMCLVQVEKVPKPLPACATPVAEGMKVYTRSEFARNAQKAVMEFLLINHPLDCPICDQGGECELQDLALGYGRDISRFTEKKRVVKDKNIGPLIATDMTRCIHCTRCVRFLEEIAGHKELGGTGRGEDMEIGTYIEHAIESELSGNVIDVCPVGALTSKPFRFRARAWELTQHASIAPHDSMGSNLYLHAIRGEVMRAVPNDNEEINEVWLSDRDRFSYQGLYSNDRAQTPLVKRDGAWREVDWDTALQVVADGLRQVISTQGADQLGILVSPTATLEEMYLLRRISEGVGCPNIDHRLRQADFSDQDTAPLFPWLGQTIEELEQLDAALLVGTNIRKEQPIAAHRLRKASLTGAQLMVVNPIDFDFRFKVAHKAIAKPSDLVRELAGIAAGALALSGKTAPPAFGDVFTAITPDVRHRAIAETLHNAKKATLLLGNLVTAHPQGATLRSLAGLIAESTCVRLGYLPEAANSGGGWLAGVLPHRGPAGDIQGQRGRTARALLEQPPNAFLLFGIEPEHDTLNATAARNAVESAGLTVVMSAYASETTKHTADVILPVAPFTETSGTFVNAEGRWQSFAGVTAPLGAARPAWKVLRVLGNLLGLEGFDYLSSDEVRNELRARLGERKPDNMPSQWIVSESVQQETGLERVGEVAMHALDPLVRRASALQETVDAANGTVRLSSADAERQGLGQGDTVEIHQENGAASFVLTIDDRVPQGAVWLRAGDAEAAKLGSLFGAVQFGNGQDS